MAIAAFKLEESGFTREQIEALSEFLDGSVATKADVERLNGSIIELDGNMKAEVQRLEGSIIELEGNLKAEIQKLRGEVGVQIQEVRGNINRQTWMLGILITVNAGVLLKLVFV